MLNEYAIGLLGEIENLKAELQQVKALNHSLNLKLDCAKARARKYKQLYKEVLTQESKC